MTLSTATNVIGIHGPLNGGKDTIANYLQYVFEHRFERYAFALPLKEACRAMFGFTKEQLEDRVLKETIDPFWNFAPRRAMQLLGTEYGRNMLRDDLWIKRAELEVEKNLKNGHGTIITDVRFENEAGWVRSRSDAILIYIEVPGLVRDERYNHASEAGISRAPTDIIVINDKSLGIQHLHSKLNELFGYG